MLYTVVVLFDEDGGADENPNFDFTELSDAVKFIEICFKNQYDVLIKAT